MLRQVSDRVAAFNHWYQHDIPLGPRAFKVRQAINAHKLLVIPLVLGLMWQAKDFSLAPLLYLALHGSYGLLWVVKDIAFGDPQWRRPVTLGSLIGVFVYPLGVYLLPPILI